MGIKSSYMCYSKQMKCKNKFFLSKYLKFKGEELIEQVGFYAHSVNSFRNVSLKPLSKY